MNFIGNVFKLQTNSNYILTTQEKIGAPDSVNYGAQLFYYLLVLGVILVLAYYTTKLISKSKLRGLSSKNINIVEMVSVGVGISLAIVKIGEQFFLVSISKEKINLVSEIDGSQLDFNSREDVQYDFSEYFKKHLKKIKGNDDDEKTI